MITTTGKMYRTVPMKQTGHSVVDKAMWEIQSPHHLSSTEVEEIIEKVYPHAGYGSSGWRRLTKAKDEEDFRILVSSNASCD